ncbi:MAG: sugar phosphate isomerase/epimerase [Armatimonadetes bacterium]|nr:sugar phosphate isomerase/epimerase [Armatimonadota bacterium]
MRISVQLYTLRSSFEKSVWGTFDQLAEAGFKNVELAGLYGMTPDELAAGLKERGITAHSTHMGFGDLEGKTESVVAFAKAFGLDTVVIPWLQIKEFSGGWKEVGERATEVAAELKPHGIKVAYHNHDFEFQRVGSGDTGYDILFQHASDDVLAEVDIYWVKKAGFDPVRMLKQMSDRLPLAHFKDIDEEGFFTQVGQGSIDWPSVIEVCKAAKTKFAIIENDQPKIDPVDAVVQSRQYLLGLGLKD